MLPRSRDRRRALRRYKFLIKTARRSSSSFIASLISSRVWLGSLCDLTLLRLRHRGSSVGGTQRREAGSFGAMEHALVKLSVQPTEQPNQKNNRQWNADKPKQYSASHDVYSYLALHKLNATTTLKLNRSGSDHRDGMRIALLVPAPSSLSWSSSRAISRQNHRN